MTYNVSSRNLLFHSIPFHRFISGNEAHIQNITDCSRRPNPNSNPNTMVDWQPHGGGICVLLSAFYCSKKHIRLCKSECNRFCARCRYISFKIDISRLILLNPRQATLYIAYMYFYRAHAFTHEFAVRLVKWYRHAHTDVHYVGLCRKWNLWTGQSLATSKVACGERSERLLDASDV